jgi:hypothetical protein
MIGMTIPPGVFLYPSTKTGRMQTRLKSSARQFKLPGTAASTEYAENHHLQRFKKRFSIA